MFTITSTHALNWPGLKFKLKKGENSFADDSKIPVEAREKMARFRERGVLSFDAPKAWGLADKPAEEASKAPAAGGDGDGFDPAGVELTEAALGKLKLDQLRLVAAELEVDASALKTKAEVVAAVLKEASVGGGEPSA